MFDEEDVPLGALPNPEHRIITPESFQRLVPGLKVKQATRLLRSTMSSSIAGDGGGPGGWGDSVVMQIMLLPVKSMKYPHAVRNIRSYENGSQMFDDSSSEMHTKSN